MAKFIFNHINTQYKWYKVKTTDGRIGQKKKGVLQQNKNQFFKL